MSSFAAGSAKTFLICFIVCWLAILPLVLGSSFLISLSGCLTMTGSSFFSSIFGLVSTLGLSLGSSLLSKVTNGVPSETLSPIFTFKSLI